jgi:hypothetical protein
MAENDKLVLSDKSIVPTDDYIYSFIGSRKSLWKALMDHVATTYKDAEGNWNYYNDGKQWLYKLVQKKKTLFWGGILQGTFRITFYFGDKAEPVIEGSDLPQNIKDGFKTAKRYGLIRPISLLVNDETDIDCVFKLIAIKCKIK